MSALNMDETEKLRDVQRCLDYVLKNGYDPSKADMENNPEARTVQDLYTKSLLNQSRNSVRTIVTMKGYYPK